MIFFTSDNSILNEQMIVVNYEVLTVNKKPGKHSESD